MTSQFVRSGEVTDLDVVAGQLTRWIDLSERLMLDSLAIAPNEAERWIRARLSAAVDETFAPMGFVPDETDRALVSFDLDLNAQGLAFAASKKRA
ncbi:MAG: hypothetical protein U0326_34750 [Polyangiales bacterium]